ncbi:1-aminocyclopropane-1-carboxylate deaminase/D-cysteine desulfhydrase [Flavobacteriaceae bacterium M23B6Z8]
MRFFEPPEIKNQQVLLPELQNSGVEIFIKREDQIHPYISGNKYRKLKYNLLDASAKKYSTLLSFGGAFSNHIAAVAQAGESYGFDTIGIIRGEELKDKISVNPTLAFAKSKGMKLVFVSREEYRQKSEKFFIDNLADKFGSFYLLLEGGTNALAVKGCEEILQAGDRNFTHVAVCVGTGGTISGLINASCENMQILGFPALKGDFLTREICKFATKENWCIIPDYTFGGYAKIDGSLIDFMNRFYAKTGIPLDPVYTGKMMYGILDLVKMGYFKKGTSILAIHTGGLQGIEGMNQRLKEKNLPLIHL